MKFQILADYFFQLEKTSSRNKITEIFAGLLKESLPEEIDKICYLSLGRLAPLYAGIEFNIAEKLIIRIIARAYGLSEEVIKKEYKKIGDLGEVAYQLRTSNLGFKTKKLWLSVDEVYKRLYEIAAESGKGSVGRKIQKMVILVGELDPLSVKYIVRIPLGKLRLGFSDLTIMDALSWMVKGDKSLRVAIENAFNVRADIGQVAQKIKTQGIGGLRGLKVKLGVPVMPALCQRVPTAEEMIEKVGEGGLVAVEPKYDGTRLQIHFSKRQEWGQPADQLPFDFRPKGFIRSFTRNLENNTHMFPDLVQAVFEETKANEAILDGEAIGFDPKTEKFLPFQETMKRKRKYAVHQKAKEIPLKYFAFDILYKEGEDLLKAPFEKRRRILEKTITSDSRTILLSPQILTSKPEELRAYHDKQIVSGLEGVIVKKWQALYDPGRRGFTWVKFKQEAGKKGGGLADTLDCVMMGYYKGRGKRAVFGIGAFLVGVRESATTDKFLTISKIGTGLTDEQWKQLKVQSSKFKAQSQPKEYEVDKNLIPDAWVAPGLVVEIQADNITKSPVHAAGLALRFPRLVKFRDDKSPQEATTLAEVRRLYRLQG